MRFSLLFVLIFTAPCLAADDVQQIFDQLFAKRIAAVKTTRATDDDLDLAKQLLSGTHEATGSPQLLTMMCENAITLALRDPSGFDTALAAVELLYLKVPSRGTWCHERRIDIHHRRFITAKGGDRHKAGEALISVVFAATDHASGAGDSSAAAEYLGRAIPVARAIKSPRLTDISDRRESVMKRAAVHRQIEKYKVRLKANPGERVTNAKLMMLYMVDLDDPVKALAHVERGTGANDPERKLLPVAAGKMQGSDDDLLALGQWYESLAAKATGEIRVRMLKRAEGWLSRYLQQHQQVDLPRTRAEVSLEKIRSELALADNKTKPTVTEPNVATEGKWVDLLSDIRLGSGYGRDGRGIRSTKKNIALFWARSPLVPKGDYEITVQLSNNHKTSPVLVSLPVGDTDVAILRGGSFIVLSYVDGSESNASRRKVSMVVVQKPYTIDARVEVRGDQARIQVALDGTKRINWTGPISSLKTRSKNSDQDVICFGCKHMGMRVLTAKIRMIKGEIHRP